MPQVIQIRRQPNGWDAAGQGFQNAAQTWLQGNTALAQQQADQTRQMLQFALGERRLADQNARDDRRWNETREMQQARFAQEDKWKAEQLALQRQQLGMQQSEKAQARALNDKVMKMLSGGGTMGASPVDADFTAALNGSSSGVPVLPSFNLAPQDDGFGTGGAGGMGGMGLLPAPSLSFGPSNSQLGLSPMPEGQSPTITPDPFGVQAPSFMMKPSHAPTMGAKPDLGNAQGMSSAAPTYGAHPQLTGALQNMGIDAAPTMSSSHTPAPGARPQLQGALRGIGINPTPPPAPTSSVSPQTQQAVNNLRRAYEEIGGIDPAQLTPQQQEIVTWGKAMGFEQPSTPAMPQMPAPASMNGLTVQNFPMELMAVPAGKAAFEKLKQMDADNRQRYQDEMKVYETAQKKMEGQRIQPNALKTATENIAMQDKVRGAYDAVEKDPDATGFLKGILNYVYSPALDRLDSAGVGTRAQLANLSSAVIKDRSGAAVTAAEFPRLRPFLPQIGDNADTIKYKLREFYRVVQEENALYLKSLREAGYAVPPSLSGASSAPLEANEWEDVR